MSDSSLVGRIFTKKGRSLLTNSAIGSEDSHDKAMMNPDGITRLFSSDKAALLYAVDLLSKGASFIEAARANGKSSVVYKVDILPGECVGADFNENGDYFEKDIVGEISTVMIRSDGCKLDGSDAFFSKEQMEKEYRRRTIDQKARDAKIRNLMSTMRYPDNDLDGPSYQ